MECDTLEGKLKTRRGENLEQREGLENSKVGGRRELAGCRMGMCGLGHLAWGWDKRRTLLHVVTEF